MPIFNLVLLSFGMIVGGGRSFLGNGSSGSPQNPYVPFQGEKSSWHDGFDRYDFVMDGETSAISPFRKPDGEGFGVGGPVNGKSRCIVVCPKHPAAGNPWSWQACYWDHQPQTEVELLRRGFHVAYVSADADLKPDRRWDAWYEFLTAKHGLSKKPVFVGMSRGGQYELRWATTHPDRVSGIYGDNPAADEGILQNLLALARNDVPILFVCGTNDPLLAQHALSVEAIYRQFGGRVSMMLKEGAGHHPHSLHDPKPIADFLERSFLEKTPEAPAFASGNRYERSSYYGIENRSAKYPEDGYFVTTRGAAFTECYDLYRVWLGFDGPVTVIEPKKEAPGRPWVLRSSYVERDAMIDRALLAKGFHIVVGPVGYNADGPSLAEWNKVYSHLVQNGFARKPVLEGEGGGAGSVLGWAVANPDKVACVYTKNPIVAAPGFEKQPIESLAPLAGVGVRIFLENDSLDLFRQEESHRLEQGYRQVKGVIVEPKKPADRSQEVIDFLLDVVRANKD